MEALNQELTNMIFYDREIRKVHLELSSNCNLRCPQCPRTHGDDPNPNLVVGELTLAKVRELLSPEDILTLDHIYACGNYGDPLMARDVLDIFDYLRQSNPNVLLAIHTNGSLRNESFYRRLVEVLGERHYVVFAIDGLEDTNHIYRRDANWRKLMANTKAFIAAGGHAHWHYLVFEHNQHQLNQARLLAKEMGFDKFTTKKSYRKVASSIPWLKKVTGDFQHTKQVYCESFEKKEIYIGANGVIAPCCYLGGQEQRYKAYPEDLALTNEQINKTPFKPDLATCVSYCSVTNHGQTLANIEHVKEEELR